MIRADKDWETANNQQRSNTAGCAYSSVGNMTSFIIFECLPDRIELLSYLNKLGLLHDGILNPLLERQ